MEKVKRQSSLPRAKRNSGVSLEPVQTLLESTNCFSAGAAENRIPMPRKTKTATASQTLAANTKKAAVRKENQPEPPKKSSTTRSGINYLQFPSLFPVSELEECGVLVREEAKNTPTAKATKKSAVSTPLNEKTSTARNGKASTISAFTSRNEDSHLQRVEVGSVATVAAPVSQSRSLPANAPGSRRFASLGSFVPGLSNRLAKTAAEVVVDQPGRMNPLYIHGGTSLGKTHLLEGICSESRKRKGRQPALFLTAEQFTSAFIDGLKNGTPSFRSKFRNISMLLIDDIPFLTGKTSTQSELLQLIDQLKTQGVQLVFSGDRPLSELKGIRPEILSRLESGMVCGIEPPERETLLSIFRQMIKQRGLPFSDEVARFVVSRLNSNVRQLSGALNRLHTVHLANGKPMTVKLAEEVLDDLIRSNRKSVKLADIEKVVCETFGLGEDSLQSRSRTKQVSAPRMLAMWLARKYTRNALSEIGKYFGNRSHSTVVSAQKKVDSWISDEAEIDLHEQPCPIGELIRKVEQNLQAG